MDLYFLLFVCNSLHHIDNYIMYSGDVEWLQNVWTNYTKAVAFVEDKVDHSQNGTGLMDITGLRDWARQAGGGFSSEGNAILYKVCYQLLP